MSRLKKFGKSILEAKLSSDVEKVLMKLGFEKFEIAKATMNEKDDAFEIILNKNLSFPPTFLYRLAKADVTMTYYSGELSLLIPK